MMYVFPLDLDHLEPAPSKPGAAKRVRLSLSPGPATPPGNEVYILGHILALAYWKLHYRGPHSYARSKLTIYGIFF